MNAPAHEFLRIKSYPALQAGPRLLATGAVHGKERCGTAAIFNVISAIEAGKIVLKRGEATFIPICNPRAYEQGLRHVGRDLNRELYPRERPSTYEERIGNQLCAELGKTDILLDLHSYSSSDTPFVYLGPYKEEERAFAAALGARNFVEGFEDAYNDTNFQKDRTQPVGTTEYARLHGAMAVTLECGQHDSPHAPVIAYRAILGALHHHGMIDLAPEDIPPIVPRDAPCVRLTAVRYKMAEGSFTRPWNNFDRVKAGDVIARYDNGMDPDTLVARHDGFIIMPDPTIIPEPRGEWFYLGVESRLHP